MKIWICTHCHVIWWNKRDSLSESCYSNMLVHVFASGGNFPSQFSESSTIPLRVFPDICGVRCVCNKWIPFTRVSRSFSLASTVPHRNLRRLPKTAFLAFMTAFPLRSTKISESYFASLQTTQNQYFITFQFLTHRWMFKLHDRFRSPEITRRSL